MEDIRKRQNFLPHLQTPHEISNLLPRGRSHGRDAWASQATSPPRDHVPPPQSWAYSQPASALRVLRHHSGGVYGVINMEICRCCGQQLAPLLMAVIHSPGVKGVSAWILIKTGPIKNRRRAVNQPWMQPPRLPGAGGLSPPESGMTTREVTSDPADWAVSWTGRSLGHCLGAAPAPPFLRREARDWVLPLWDSPATKGWKTDRRSFTPPQKACLPPALLSPQVLWIPGVRIPRVIRGTGE